MLFGWPGFWQFPLGWQSLFAVQCFAQKPVDVSQNCTRHRGVRAPGVRGTGAPAVAGSAARGVGRRADEGDSRGLGAVGVAVADRPLAAADVRIATAVALVRDILVAVAVHRSAHSTARVSADPAELVPAARRAPETTCRIARLPDGAAHASGGVGAADEGARGAGRRTHRCRAGSHQHRSGPGGGCCSTTADDQASPRDLSPTTDLNVRAGPLRRALCDVFEPTGHYWPP